MTVVVVAAAVAVVVVVVVVVAAVLSEDQCNVNHVTKLFPLKVLESILIK